MKTLIAYCTTHGCTGKTAVKLKDFLGEDVHLVNLKQEKNPNLKEYERVIIGGSIHAGQIQKRIKEFSIKNLDELQTKELGLFICCMEEGEKAHTQLMEAYPEELHNHAKAATYFGGEFDFEKMNFFQRMIIKKVAHVENNVSKIDHEAIKKFSRKMDRVFNPFLFLV